ncbi:MAG: hypothetical protein ACYCYA_09235 [Actinomycetes bacterium]
MSPSTIAILLVVLGGFLLGGAWSVLSQHKSRVVSALLGLAGALALAAGVLRLIGHR